MMEKIINLIKNNSITIPRILLNNYISLGIDDKELILLIYLMNENDTIFNPSKISSDLNINLTDILSIISKLNEKDLLKIKIQKIDKLTEEHINIENLYKKLAFLIVNEEEVSSNIFDTFEKEFGRTLSPMEYEIISSWLDNKYEEELIVEALKEAVFNNVSSLNYVDRILQDWKKKGIKNTKDIEKERIKFKEKKDKPKQLFDYDWLNDKQDN